MSEFEYADYEGLLSLARNAGTNIAKMFIPRLCEQLKREHPEMSNVDVRDNVTNDCADVWSKATIRKFMPDEYKDEVAAELARKKHEKDRLLSITSGGQQFTNENIAGTVPAEDGSDSSTEQESERFEDMDRGPDVKHYEKAYNQLQDELRVVRETYEDKLKKAEEKLDFAQNPDNLERIPELVDDKIGPVKVQNLSKISQFDRRGYQILAGRFAELVKRKIATEGKAGVKFYILSKDRTTNIEYLVPVIFSVDMSDKSTDVFLDESRL